jgi:hypothetical protein
MKKTVYTLIILLVSSCLYAQKQVDGLKITYNDNGIKTQTFQLDSVAEWGYDLTARKVFVKPLVGNKLEINPSNFFQFEFPKMDVEIKKAIFNGYVQKGPYVNGSSVVITQLNEDLNQTGNVFSTQIIDNAGSFEQRNIEFASSFVELKADGYYYNEVKGETSTSPLTLYSLVDIGDLNAVNVNILTHLERQRIMYLIWNDKLSFSEAKTQARGDVLNIFKFALPDNISTESLNIADDALLLAVSALIQGHLSTGDMSELLANISADIRTDGTLDNPVLGSQLMNNAAYIDLEQVKFNMDKKYSGLGINVNVNDTELKSYIQQFMQNSGFEQTSFIAYPETGYKNSLNFLAHSFMEAQGSKFYSMVADLPAGTSLKIIMKAVDGSGAYWGSFNAGGMVGWTMDYIWDEDNYPLANVFTIEGEAVGAFRDTFSFGRDTIVEYYENGSIEPTKVKEIKVIID